MVNIASVLAIQEGTKRLPNIPIQTNRHESKTLEISIFREGLTHLTAICVNDWIDYLLKGFGGDVKCQFRQYSQQFFQRFTNCLFYLLFNISFFQRFTAFLLFFKKKFRLNFKHFGNS